MSSPIRIGRVAGRKHALAAAVLAAVLTALAGCSGDGGGKGEHDASADPSAPSVPASSGLPASLTGQKPDWEDCPAPTTAQGTGKAPGGDWQCATIKAPLDYAHPGGRTVDLALIRLPAKDEDRRIGSLLFNFGGPGASGVATLPGFADDYDHLRSRYDLVSFDPRGVGESAGVRCLGDKALDAYAAVDATPDNDAEVKTAVAANKRFDDACEKNSGSVLPHVDTVSAARDMDLMRGVLGDRKLSYFGISYGTELGGVYAHLFPKNVGRAVLDGVVDPTEDPESGAYGQAKGFQLALDDYLADCAKKGPACPTGGDAERGDEKITTFLKSLDANPLPTSDGRRLTQDQALDGIAAALYDKETWKYLTVGLTEGMTAHRGDILLLLSDSLSGRDEKGHYNNLQPANVAISCVDDKQRYTLDDVTEQLPRFRKASAVFGESMAWGMLTCTDWPVKGRTDHPRVDAEGAAKILVVGNTGDPATPYAGAEKMARGLGEDVGVRLTYKGEGHGAYNSGNGCMTKRVDAYLLDGKVPADGTTCS